LTSFSIDILDFTRDARLLMEEYRFADYYTNLNCNYC